MLSQTKGPEEGGRRQLGKALAKVLQCIRNDGARGINRVERVQVNSSLKEEIGLKVWYKDASSKV